MIERLLGVGTDRFERHPRAAIEVGAQHFENARGGKTFLALADRHLALELMHRTHKFGGRPRMQPEFV